MTMYIHNIIYVVLINVANKVKYTIPKNTLTNILHCWPVITLVLPYLHRIGVIIEEIVRKLCVNSKIVLVHKQI